ncbi:hypothetical protein AALP_AAs70586U000100 [Arabis alpina]|uniref:Uncharacterized protein n=1 Tax=Arabis alpina TaxID=50452 RepID=A0A087G3P3_ARAAL|nr:hypothetical protein AALP_AAs70586U000100 [Arabis alpina]
MVMQGSIPIQGSSTSFIPIQGSSTSFIPNSTQSVQHSLIGRKRFLCDHISH